MESRTSVFRGSLFVQGFTRMIERLSLSSIFTAPGILTLARWLFLPLLFSCLFVPRFSIGSVATFYRVDLRAEDLLLVALGFLALGILTRKIRLPEVSAVEKAFLWFLLAAQVSIASGFFYGTIDKPVLSFLYLVKWVEYFLVLVIASRLVTHRRDFYFFLKTFFFLGIAVTCFGWWEYFFPAAKAVYPNYYRLFERFPFHGDANHIGGLLVLWMGFFTGLFLKAEDRRVQIFLYGALLLTLFPLIWSYSRKSYFALAGALVFAFLFQGSRKRLLFLISTFVILSLAFPTRLAERLLDLGETFQSVDPFHSSWATNWVMWKQAFWNFEQFFIFGSGLASRHRLFYESQYVLILTETGFVGFTAFMLIGGSLIRRILPFLASAKTALDQGVVRGWLIGFVGLAIHNFSAVSWTVSKIAIPFWFLTAVVLSHLTGTRHPEARWAEGSRR